MKLRILTIIILSLFLTQTSFSQKNSWERLKYNLSVDETEWRKENKIIAKLSIQNICDKKTRVNLQSYFHLIREGINENDSAIVGYNTYYSYPKFKAAKENIRIFEISDEDKIMFFPEFNLEANESKTVEMNLTKLFWGQSISAFKPHKDWYEAMPKGNYRLSVVTEFQDEKSTGIVNKRIESNKIRVVLLDGIND